MKNWFNTLNESLESEGLLDIAPTLFGGFQYDSTKTFNSNGVHVSVYRSEIGLYERPIHYRTKAEDSDWR